MRTRVATLLVALILLGAAVPAVLDCCFHGPEHGAPRVSAARLVLDDTVRGCVDQAAPAQTPYIEPTSTGGGAAPASARGVDAADTPYAAAAVDGARSARTTARAPDSTGPPLWLSSCVSRT
jgi:hypothetical protein